MRDCVFVVAQSKFTTAHESTKGAQNQGKDGKSKPSLPPDIPPIPRNHTSAHGRGNPLTRAPQSVVVPPMSATMQFCAIRASGGGRRARVSGNGGRASTIQWALGESGAKKQPWTGRNQATSCHTSYEPSPSIVVTNRPLLKSDAATLSSSHTDPFPPHISQTNIPPCYPSPPAPPFLSSQREPDRVSLTSSFVRNAAPRIELVGPEAKVRTGFRAASSHEMSVPSFCSEEQRCEWTKKGVGGGWWGSKHGS